VINSVIEKTMPALPLVGIDFACLHIVKLIFMKRYIYINTLFAAFFMLSLLSCGPKNRSEHMDGGIPDRTDTIATDSVTRGHLDTARRDSLHIRDSMMHR
jgi:hypothetical protein